ncbi:hypothetical protein PSHT_15135 [Puccinia striiformis]|uniref:Uncharacterized protein n=1 Tax=Puccinia striiformis TaxID=27350 RepID=A0A2S4UGK3_9BASI|nr:hypothetical protein PSHT_15135 [Puccinia striiformis]
MNFKEVEPAYFGAPGPQRPLSVLPPNPVNLTQRQKNIIVHLNATKGKTSLIALGYFLFSCFGKLIFGFGASMAVKGVCANDTATLGVGAGLCAFGFICILIVAFGFGAACHHMDKARGILFKCISILAAVLIATGYAVNQYFVSTHHDLMDIRLSFFPLFIGAALLVISLGNFFAYTELAKGATPCIPRERRPFVAMCFFGPGIGTVFAGWITGEKGEWPVVFNAAVLTVALACFVLGNVSLLVRSSATGGRVGGTVCDARCIPTHHRSRNYRHTQGEGAGLRPYGT